MERSAYTVQSNTDLPPSYASVVSVPTSPLPPASLQIDRSGEDKFEEPPSYSTVINMNTRGENAQVLSVTSNVLSSAKKDGTISAASATPVSASVSASLRRVENC